eukprot:7672547-Prorocentrum_lima.AAC.1
MRKFLDRKLCMTRAMLPEPWVSSLPTPLVPSGTQGDRRRQKQRSRLSSDSEASASPASAGVAHTQQA